MRFPLALTALLTAGALFSPTAQAGGFYGGPYGYGYQRHTTVSQPYGPYNQNYGRNTRAGGYLITRQRRPSGNNCITSTVMAERGCLAGTTNSFNHTSF